MKNFLERSAQQMSAKGLNRHGEMCRAENHHDDRSRKVMQPDGGAQKVQHRKHRQWHRDKEKRTTQERDLPARYAQQRFFMLYSIVPVRSIIRSICRSHQKEALHVNRAEQSGRYQIPQSCCRNGMKPICERYKPLFYLLK